MNKSIAEQYALTVLQELAQIRAVVESVHDLHSELLQKLSGQDKAELDASLTARITRQRKVIYRSLLKRSGLDGSKAESH